MFRKMRRTKQELEASENIEILKRNTSGVLSVCDNENYPYSVPLSYVYVNNKIYFHSAIEGHKIDVIKKNSKVSFCVIDKDDVLPEKFTTLYKSVVVFGNASIVGDKEKLEAINLLSQKYCPDFQNESKDEIEKFFDKFLIIKIDLKHISGKQCIEFLN